MFLEMEAKVSKVALRLVEPKDGPPYTQTVVTLTVDSVLSPAQIGELYKLQRGRPALVTLQSDEPQAELPLNGAAATDDESAEFEPVQEDTDGVEVGEGAEA